MSTFSSGAPTLSDAQEIAKLHQQLAGLHHQLHHAKQMHEMLEQELAECEKKIVMLRDCLKKIKSRFNYGPIYNSVEWTTLNDTIVTLAATEPKP